MKPWLENKKWRDNQIVSSSKLGLVFLLVFTILWNLISWPVVFAEEGLLSGIIRAPEKALVLLFPIVGIVLIALTVRAFLRWQRYGKIPLSLDPFPGAIDGHVGGVLDIAVPFSASNQFSVTLSCVNSYISGSGKNRSRKEKIVWQSDGYCYTEHSAKGTKLVFRFDVDAELPESEKKDQSRYHLWRVRFACAQLKPSFERSYEIPVFMTGEASANIMTGSEDHPLTEDAAMDGLYEVAQITPHNQGIKASFPALVRPLAGCLQVLFGIIFLIPGVAIATGGDQPLFGTVFVVVGGLVSLWGIYTLFKSLVVTIEPSGVSARRFLFGYPIKTRRIEKDAVSEIAIEQGATMSSGTKTTVIYKLLAKSRSDQKEIVIAERLHKRSEAEMLKELYEGYLG